MLRDSSACSASSAFKRRIFSQALKVRGKMFACIASHKSAEPNTLVVMMDFADRLAGHIDDPRGVTGGSR